MSEDLKKLELIANENLKLAEDEKDHVKLLNNAIINEIKRAKARKEFAQKELKLNGIREELVETYTKLIEKKRELVEKELINMNNKEIEVELDFSKYTELISKIQIEIAEIQYKIAELEVEIADQKSLIAYERNYVANDRIDMANKIFSYIKAIKKGKSEKKISTLQEEYLAIQETITANRKDIFKDLEKLKGIENILIDLKKELSIKLAEREKIRPKI